MVLRNNHNSEHSGLALYTCKTLHWYNTEDISHAVVAEWILHVGLGPVWRHVVYNNYVVKVGSAESITHRSVARWPAFVVMIVADVLPTISLAFITIQIEILFCTHPNSNEPIATE